MDSIKDIAVSNWEEILMAMHPVTLNDLDQVKLMNRIDSKFAFNIQHLQGILDEINNDYRILEIKNKRVFCYESQYLDTPGFNYYKNHHNGKPNRIKIRYRKYKDTGDVFFEIKKKSKGVRTDKYRVKTEYINETVANEEKKLMEQLAIKEEMLEKKMNIHYNRITLASNNWDERVTIDLNLSFSRQSEKKEFSTLVIAEIKQNKFCRTSSFVAALRKRGISQLKISKYSVAIALMIPGIKRNNFKSKIRKLNELIQ